MLEDTCCCAVVEYDGLNFGSGQPIDYIHDVLDAIGLYRFNSYDEDYPRARHVIFSIAWCNQEEELVRAPYLNPLEMKTRMDKLQKFIESNKLGTFVSSRADINPNHPRPRAHWVKVGVWTINFQTCRELAEKKGWIPNIEEEEDCGWCF